MSFNFNKVPLPCVKLNSVQLLMIKNANKLIKIVTTVMRETSIKKRFHASNVKKSTHFDQLSLTLFSLLDNREKVELKLISKKFLNKHRIIVN
jgi:D-ribose pyranose/furanose isomerase RbsD